MDYMTYLSLLRGIFAGLSFLHENPSGWLGEAFYLDCRSDFYM